MRKMNICSSKNLECCHIYCKCYLESQVDHRYVCIIIIIKLSVWGLCCNRSVTKITGAVILAEPLSHVWPMALISCLVTVVPAPGHTWLMLSSTSCTLSMHILYSGPFSYCFLSPSVTFNDYEWALLWAISKFHNGLDLVTTWSSSCSLCGRGLCQG
jgi:hypothetical protein